MRIAIIPARGGSKRIPRKNIRSFCGKPMIAWSIEAALKSACFDQVAVSTDDAEVAAIATTYGAAVPFLRPASLADDHTGTVPVIQHAVNWYREQGAAPDVVCCIYATAPFLNPEDLRQGLISLEEMKAEYAFSVTSYPFPIQRALRIRQGHVEMLHSQYLNTRSQDLEETFHDAGQFYWGTAAAWLEGKAVFAPHSVPVILPRHRVQDIDTEEDWLRAELMMKALMAEGG